MANTPNRRDILKAAAVTSLAALPAMQPGSAEAAPPGWVVGHKTGARALVETLQAEGTLCVFGIPGAQGNEFWDQMKSLHLPYLLVTHEAAAASMADGAARATGRPGVLCVVPGPGITNALTGLGEALLDSVPVVCIAGDVARGHKYRPFQVHELPNAALLRPVCKEVLVVEHVAQIPLAVRQAFQIAMCGEPGPVSVVVPYNLLIETHKFYSAPLAPCAMPFDECAFDRARAILSDRRLRVGIHAGVGCMDYAASLVKLAEVLQAPVSTSVSGKGVINECHPLSVGWGYGKQGTRTAEKAFEQVDVVLAVGVKFSEVSTGFYCLPKKARMIQVDAKAENLGVSMPAEVCVHSDAGVFLSRMLDHAGEIARPACPERVAAIRRTHHAEACENAVPHARHGVDPMLFLLALRKATCENALVFTDVSVTEHWAAEAFKTYHPRTYFNPVDNQAMGWSIPAALGAQRVAHGTQVVTVTGDGCFLMSAMELSTAAREGLPVKFFVLDDQVYHYMQVLQLSAYKRTTATHLAHIDYASLAKGLGVAHVTLDDGCDLEAKIRGILAIPGPVLVNVVVDHGDRQVRWIKAVKGRFTAELSTSQKVRFAARLGARSVAVGRDND